MQRTLKLGTAYHGNRILRHVEEDMTDIVNHHMNTVVHMYTHNDMDRHHDILKDIIAISEDKGLEVWVDNWGIDAGPGDKCYFTGMHPETKQIYADGTPAALKPCYNHPVFRDFTKRWIDAVATAGGKTLFWDEPHIANSDEHGFACRCPLCQKLFAEHYNHTMSEASEAELEAFRLQTVADYFRFATDYAHECSMVNTGCIMFAPHLGSGFDMIEKMMSLPHFDNVGCDPYWVRRDNASITAAEVYRYNYTQTKQNLDFCHQYGKDHNVWLQSYAFGSGREDEMIIAAEAIYDAGARTILTWSFRGAESNDYRAKNTDMVWDINGEIMAHLRQRHYADILNEIRANLK